MTRPSRILMHGLSCGWCGAPSDAIVLLGSGMVITLHGMTECVSVNPGLPKTVCSTQRTPEEISPPAVKPPAPARSAA